MPIRASSERIAPTATGRLLTISSRSTSTRFSTSSARTSSRSTGTACRVTRSSTREGLGAVAAAAAVVPPAGGLALHAETRPGTSTHKPGVLHEAPVPLPLLTRPGFPFCPPDQGLCTPTRLSARHISSSHVVPLPAEAALDVEPTRAPAFRAVLRHRSTLVPFLRQAASLHSSRVSLPGQVAPRSSAACRRTAAGSDDLPPGGASSTLRASPAGPRSSPAAAGDS